MTVSDYMHELDPEKVKKIEEENGITLDEIEKAEQQKAHNNIDENKS